MKRKLRGFISIVVIVAILGIAITAFAESKSIEAVFKNIKISINGTQVTNMDVEPFIYNNRTFVPVRFVTDNLGMKINYNNATDTVEITKNTAPSTPSIPSGSSAVDVYKNNMKEFLYVTDLKKIADDFMTVGNDYVFKTDMYVTGNQTGVRYDVNFNLTKNLYSSAQTLYKTIDVRNNNIGLTLGASDSILTQKQIDDFKSNIDSDILNINELFSTADNYSAISNTDNKNIYKTQNILTLNKLQADSNLIDKYYNQLLSAIKN